MSWYHKQLWKFNFASMGVILPGDDAASHSLHVTFCHWLSLSTTHGRQRHWNIGGSQVERRRRENRGTVGGEGDGVWGGAVPFPENL